jgi:hypothetical protein
MGAWGTGVLSDDTTRDIYDSYLDLFNRGGSPTDIRERLSEQFAEILGDKDEGPLFWIAIAKAQWDCGQLEPISLSNVRQIVTEELGLDLWADAGESLLRRRKTVLRQFLSTIETPNARPRTPRQAIKRKPIFNPGDCLAVRQQDGDWGAALVLQGEPESSDPFVETLGKNLVVHLLYKNSVMPTLEVFDRREWLYLTHHNWDNQMAILYVMAIRFRPIKDRIVRVGTIQLKDTDPSTARLHTAWPNVLDAMYLQERWDRGIRE